MLVINLDNGPENHSHRTQFLNRLVTFAQASQLAVELAYEAGDLGCTTSAVWKRGITAAYSELGSCRGPKTLQ
jgi:hypothetical protein